MGMLPSYQRALQAEVAFYRSACVLSCMAGLVALSALIGIIIKQPWLTHWGFPGSELKPSTALAVIALSIVTPLYLAPRRLDKHSSAIRLLGYACFLFPAIFGLYYTIYHLVSVHFNFLAILSRPALKGPQFLTAVSITIFSGVILTLIKWRNRENIVVYGAGFPAVIMFSIALFAILGHWQHLPHLPNFMMSCPCAVAFLFLTLGLLMGTIPFKGLFLPLLSLRPKTVLMSILSVFGGLALLIKGLEDIHSIHQLVSGNLTHLTRHLVVSAMNTVCLTTLFVVLSLRALHNYDEAAYRAAAQKEYTDTEALLRRATEIIHNDLPIHERMQRITHLISAVLGYEYCVITGFAANTGKIKEPFSFYDATNPLWKPQLSNPMQEALEKILPEICREEQVVEISQLNPQQIQAIFPSNPVYGLAAPMLYRDQCLGAVFLAKKQQPKNMPYIEKRIINSLAEQLAIVITQQELLDTLKITELNFQKILDANIIGVIFWRLDGTVTYANQAFLDMTGYTREDIKQGKVTWPNLIPHSEEEEYFRRIREIVEKGIILPRESHFQTKDGKLIDVIRSSTMLEGDKNEVFSFIVNITKRKQVETELTEKNKELEQFASIASHDLQAPLRKIRTFLDILQQDAKDRLTETDLAYIERVQSSALRMQQLISDLLSLARFSRNLRPFEQVNMRDLLHQVLHDLAIEIAQRQAIVEVGELFPIDADPTQAYQLLQNLLSNGLKYQKPDLPPHIKIHMEKVGSNRCRLICEDNGIGFSPDKTEWIFNPFIRIHPDSQTKGTGIGLAICRKITERHQGKIWAVSQPGEGATFIAELPIRQTSLSPATFDSESISKQD